MSLSATDSQARVFEIFADNADSSCNEEFESVANNLQPGDELILHGGEYSQSCRRAISIRGTTQHPIIIRAAHGETPILTRPADNIDSQNNIEFVDCQHLVVSGLTFRGGSIGVRFMGTTNDVTLTNNHIHSTGNNAIAAHSGNTTRLTIVGNEINNTGNSRGDTEGEGLYLGCHDNTCRVTDSLIANNYIHDLKANSSGGNDGIELKFGSGGNTVRGNVVHNTTIGTAYPCIFAYGGGQRANLIEDNVLSKCGDGIQVVRDAIIRNNIIVHSKGSGILATFHKQAGRPSNLAILNNTIYSHRTCLLGRFKKFSNITIANNALYCEHEKAVDIRGAKHITLLSNAASGNLKGLSFEHTGVFDGETASNQFIQAEANDFRLKQSSILNRAGTTIVDESIHRFLNDKSLPINTNREAPVDVGILKLTTVNAAIELLDSDRDGIANQKDNCQLVANPVQHDSDRDGIGNLCDADLNNDSMVNLLDVALFVDDLIRFQHRADFNSDGVINFIDFEILKRYAQSTSGSPNSTYHKRQH